MDGMGEMGMGVGATKCWIPRNIIIEDSVRHGPQVEWSTMPQVETFRNYIRLLSERSETAIEIDEKAFARQGISPDSKLSTRLVDLVSELLDKHLGPDSASLLDDRAWRNVTKTKPNVNIPPVVLCQFGGGMGAHSQMSVDRAVVVLTMLLHNEPVVVDAGGTLHCFMGDEGLLITDAKAIQAVLHITDEGWSEEEFKEARWLDSAGSYRVRLPDGNEAAMSPVPGSGRLVPEILPIEFRRGGFCWVAREVFGERDPRWLLFREWLLSAAPSWLLEAYGRHGQDFARWIHDKPAAKSVVRLLMDAAIANRVATMTSLAR